jgi:hypothetical protein
VSNDNYTANVNSDNSLACGGAEGKDPSSLNETKHSLNGFGERLIRSNFSKFNLSNKVSVAGILRQM